MIEKLSIKGFKSIRELDLSCRRVNVFIGEPNTGKTNILEALGLWCFQCYGCLSEVLRVQVAADLFWDQDMQREILVTLNEKRRALLKSDGGNLRVSIAQEGGSSVNMQLHDNLTNGPKFGSEPGGTRYYLFYEKQKDSLGLHNELEPPFGQNLPVLLYANKQARETAANFFTSTGLRLIANAEHGKQRLSVAKEHEGVLLLFPYLASSETIRRMVFYQLALDTNRDTTLVFDEPEAHAFPPFTKRLAERIASDDRGNQFFLTTHSPYMLDSLLSKTPAADLNVVLCRMEDFATKAYPLNETQIGKLMEWSMDAFFNFDRLLDTDA